MFLLSSAWCSGKKIKIDQVPAATNLKVIHFHLANSALGSRLLSSLLPFQHLRELVLSGSGQKWPKPESIHLPTLTSLTLTLFDPMPALAAMVVPNLDYLACSRPDYCGWADVFGNFPDQFANARQLCLNGVTITGRSSSPSSESDAVAICVAFPGVRHVELPANDIPAFFTQKAPAEHWSHLEGLTFKGLKVGAIPYDLVRWLEKRKPREDAPLHVTFSKFLTPDSAPDGLWLTRLYKSMRGRCVLELKDVPLTTTVKTLPSSQKDMLDSFGNRGAIRDFIDEDGFEG